MSEEIKRTADWAPGTLDKTRKNIGDLSKNEAELMAKKLGGQVMYERSGSGGAQGTRNTGRIVRASDFSSGSSNNNRGNSKNSSGSGSPNQKKYRREELPNISKKANAAIDKLMMSMEYKIKPNYGLFNFLRSFKKNGTEKINYSFYEYQMKQMIEHMEAFITVIKTLIQIAPSTYKAKIANDSETKFKFLRMVASWSLQPIKMEYQNLQSLPQPLLVADLVPLTRAIFHQLITLYYYGTNKIPKLIKEIYNDECAYPDSPKDKLSGFAKQAITEWLYIDTQIIKRLYPLLMRMCSDTYEPYPSFFNAKVGNILKFEGLHKFDLLLPEQPKEEKVKEEKKEKIVPPKKGLKDSTVITGLKLLNQLFPDSGFDKLETHPDMYPYFQPIFKFTEGFNILAPDNPLQVTLVLQRIIEDCFVGCRNIKFTENGDSKKSIDSIYAIMDDWSAYREDTFGHLYREPLVELANSVYSQPDYEHAHIGKRTINGLQWQTTYHFLPNFKFDQLILEHPADESKYRPLFHRTDYARKYLTLAVNQCDQAAKTKGHVLLVENPWQHYTFDIPNEVSKRLDVLLGAQNKTATTTATNANLLKYTLSFMAVLDWWINNPESPAYTSDPMHIFRISDEDGKPQFTVPVRKDQGKLFADSIRANYTKQAK